jgi:hypothetical protein
VHNCTGLKIDSSPKFFSPLLIIYPILDIYHPMGGFIFHPISAHSLPILYISSPNSNGYLVELKRNNVYRASGVEIVLRSRG